MVLPFRSRRSNLRLRPINRIKHVFDKQSALALGTGEFQVLVNTIDAPTIANPVDVETGCTINGIYLKLEAVTTGSTVLPNFYMYVAKNPGGNLSLPEANAVGVNDNKKFVIHQEMVMFQRQTGSNPRTVFNGVIVIPRGYRRFGPNDQLVLRAFAAGNAAEYCLQCHYKEFR